VAAAASGSALAPQTPRATAHSGKSGEHQVGRRRDICLVGVALARIDEEHLARLNLTLLGAVVELEAADGDDERHRDGVAVLGYLLTRLQAQADHTHRPAVRDLFKTECAMRALWALSRHLASYHAAVEILFLGRAEVERLLDLDQLIEALAVAFKELSSGRAAVPPRTAAVVPGSGLLASMPGYLPGAGLEAKLVSVFAGNHARGLPSHQAIIALFDEQDGRPLAVMDGTHITATRTAAATALSVKLLARTNARSLAILGAGVQGAQHLQAVTRVHDFADVRVASRDIAHAQRLTATHPHAQVAANFEVAARMADVICCCTDASSPIVDRDWLAPGTHITSVGSNTDGPELDRGTVTAGLLVVESRVAFSAPPAGSAELVGLDPASATEIGEILLGRHPGREQADQITVYKSMGHAVEDIAAARLVYDRARRVGAGHTVEL